MLATLRLAAALVARTAAASAQTPAPAVVTVGSWNIELFGPTKSSDPVRLARIADVAVMFDILAIQEITDASSQGQDVVDRLTDQIGSRHDRSYDVTLGPRVGCDGGRAEQYGVLFDPEIFVHIDSRSVDDQDADPATDDVCRAPWVTRFRMANPTAPLTLTLVVVHTDPNPAVALREDLNALGRVFQEVQAADAADDDVILLGDVNAEPSRWEAPGQVPDLGLRHPRHRHDGPERQPQRQPGVSVGTSDPGTDTNPLWTPDGQSLVFSSTRAGVPSIHRTLADGSDEAELLFSRENARGSLAREPGPTEARGWCSPR